MKVYIGPYVDRWTSQVHYDYMNKKYDYQWEDRPKTPKPLRNAKYIFVILNL